MSNLSGIDIAFSFDGYLLVFGLTLFAAVSWFVYKYTIPNTSLPVKIFLGAVRTIALLLILFAIFEPVITVTEKEEITPLNILAIDNSSSVIISDSVNTSSGIPGFTDEFQRNVSNAKVLLFGDSVRESNGLTFRDKSTNIEDIFRYLSDKKYHIASVTIVSDGIINEGSAPLYAAERSGVSVYTVGSGDTSRIADVSVGTILYNDLAYVDNPSPVIISVMNTGAAGKRVRVSLSGVEGEIASRNLELSESGLDKVQFEYTPEKSGNRRMIVDVSPIDGEENKANNRKIFFTEVRDNKLKILMISGSPSPDLSFVKNTLTAEEDYEISLYARLNQNIVVGGDNLSSKLDSADIITFIGYPAKETAASEINEIVGKLNSNKIPYLFIAGAGCDFNKLKLMEPLLPVRIISFKPGFTDVQPEIVVTTSPILENSATNEIEVWNNLPTIPKTNTRFEQKTGTEVLSRVKVRGIPDDQILIATASLPGRRGIFVSGANLWRWKLLRAKNNEVVFESFINNSVKWLSVPEDKKQVVVKTEKRIYAAGEKVNFTAQVYDDAFNPVDNALVELSISNGETNFTSTLTSDGGGLYTGEVSISGAGYYNFAGKARKDAIEIGEDRGAFSIGEVDAEKQNLVMNKEMLERLAVMTGGKFTTLEDSRLILEQLRQKGNEDSEYKVNVSELKLWSEEWLLYIIVALFTLEWFFRKRNGML